MAIFDGLVALGVLVGFGWLIFSKLALKNPHMLPWIKDFMQEKKDKIIKKPVEKVQQVYDSRSMM